MGETAGLLLVARPHCVLVDDGPEQSSRRHPLGHVVRRRQVLSGELGFGGSLREEGGFNPRACGLAGGTVWNWNGSNGLCSLPLCVCVKGRRPRENHVALMA